MPFAGKDYILSLKKENKKKITLCDETLIQMSKIVYAIVYNGLCK